MDISILESKIATKNDPKTILLFRKLSYFYLMFFVILILISILKYIGIMQTNITSFTFIENHVISLLLSTSITIMLIK